jgi:CubicO group peptidase (beta-lactamase class C family)
VQTRSKLALRFLSRLTLCIGLAACSARSTEAGTLKSAIDQQLTLNAQRHGIAGQAVLILHDGKPVYRGSQGLADRETGRPVRPDDVFPVYSIAKLFASILVMQAVERGELELDRPVGHYLPLLPASWRTVKVEELLNHASGLPEYFDPDHIAATFPETTDSVFESLADRPLPFRTGTETRYTQTNYLVLGVLLEKLHKMPYRQLVTDRILQPLGMRNTYLGNGRVPQGKVVTSYRGKDGRLEADHVINWGDYAIVHAELYTTIDDLGAFLNAVCEGRLVRRETLLRLWKPYRRRDGGTGWPASGWDYGTGSGYQQVGHDGGTKVRVRLLFRDSLAEDTYAFIYLTNGSAMNVWSSILIDSVQDLTLRYRRGAAH